ncbi:hypothetical protein Bca101_019524 [Brassica carinata]
MKEAFNVFDQNGDGFITVDELKTVLSSLGLKQGKTLEECRKMIIQVDVDGDGRVNYKEFRQMMKKGSAAVATSSSFKNHLSADGLPRSAGRNLGCVRASSRDEEDEKRATATWHYQLFSVLKLLIESFNQLSRRRRRRRLEPPFKDDSRSNCLKPLRDLSGGGERWLGFESGIRRARSSGNQQACVSLTLGARSFHV